MIARRGTEHGSGLGIKRAHTVQLGGGAAEGGATDHQAASCGWWSPRYHAGQVYSGTYSSAEPEPGGGRLVR
ncbi:hypothetical protein GCM10022295_26800 [Streptomyces osmaniensis]|uniref:Uncharacterized protein n=1 Tax=Streptomyces osmaniensis TaxID=593134 RepID=A0ABP6W0Z8_9ACTN